MNCVNHPASGAPAVRCASCLRSFCRDCVGLDETFYYCAACRPGGAPVGRTGAAPAAPRVQAPLESREPLFDRPTFVAARADAAAASAGSAPDPSTASLGRRGVAFLVDGALVGFAVIFALAVAGNPGTTPTFLITFGFPLIYEALFVQQTGQTIGKGLLGVQVVSAAGGPVSDAQAWVRGVFKVVQLACCGLLFLAAALSAERLALHDRAAGTRVVRGGRRGAGVTA